MIRLRLLHHDSHLARFRPSSKVLMGTPPSTLMGYHPDTETVKRINRWAFMAETILHGNPSGLDNTVSSFGGAVQFNRAASGFVQLEAFPPFQILLTNTMVPRETKALVAGVRNLHNRFPLPTQYIFDAIEAISEDFLQRVVGVEQEEAVDADGSTTSHFVRKDGGPLDVVEVTGQLMAMNHALLCSLGVGHPQLEVVCRETSTRGFVSKLTGAGEGEGRDGSGSCSGRGGGRSSGSGDVLYAR